MPIIVGIDGTGEDNNASYAKTFVKSFVSRICKKPSRDAIYFRGPNTPGYGLTKARDDGYNFIVQRLHQRRNTPQPVLLTGYSRGGAGVISIAELLKTKNIPVRAMLLFDAVDRHLTIDARDIPTNVQNVLHIRRDPSSKSRVSFGNCGLAHYPPTRYTQLFFKCTHGGAGGTPWSKGFNRSDAFINEGFESVQQIPIVPTVAIPELKLDGITNVTYMQDEIISNKIWNDGIVKNFIKEHGFL